ncbi:MAG: arginase family protein [Chitinophagaceae bacterium]
MEILIYEDLSVGLPQIIRMADFLNINEFLDPLDVPSISGDEYYNKGQLGESIALHTADHFPDLTDIDLVFVGCNEERGNGVRKPSLHSPDAIRREFFQLFQWHDQIKMADLGNVKTGHALKDSYAALKTVIREVTGFGKTIVILGGSHDLTLAQYYAYRENGQTVSAVCIDAKMDLSLEMPQPAEKFLMEMLTAEPNFIKQYNHIGFQSYLVHPEIMQTLDKLRFDCFRTGHVKEQIDEMEPVIRSSHLFSFDISAIANAFAPSNRITPNGFDGEQSCTLMQYAGMSESVNTIGIYGYRATDDRDALTAKQISHMLWYLADGRQKLKTEAKLSDLDSFNQYHTAFNEVQSIFLQSKRTGRWWMQLPEQNYIPCSYNDYIQASKNQIPERWLRAQERS